MNNEINIILGMIAGSGAFQIRLYDEAFEDFNFSNIMKVEEAVLLTDGHTILAKCVQDMSEGEITNSPLFSKGNHSLKERDGLDGKKWFLHDISLPSISAIDERYLISLGYLPEDLAKRLIEEGINIEWR